MLKEKSLPWLSCQPRQTLKTYRNSGKAFVNVALKEEEGKDFERGERKTLTI